MAKALQTTSKESELKKPIWLKYSEKEVKEIILSLANKGFTSEKIGLILRDTYGIPKTRLYGFKINQVLKENELYESPDKKNVKEKVEKLEDHFKKNKQDKKAKRALIINKANQKKIREYQEGKPIKKTRKK